MLIQAGTVWNQGIHENSKNQDFMSFWTKTDEQPWLYNLVLISIDLWQLSEVKLVYQQRKSLLLIQSESITEPKNLHSYLRLYQTNWRTITPSTERSSSEALWCTLNLQLIYLYDNTHILWPRGPWPLTLTSCTHPQWYWTKATREEKNRGDVTSLPIFHICILCPALIQRSEVHAELNALK